MLDLLFNEGYSASEGETAIRADLREEAARRKAVTPAGRTVIDRRLAQCGG